MSSAPDRHAVLLDRLLPDGRWVVTNACAEDIPVGVVFRHAVTQRGVVTLEGTYAVAETSHAAAITLTLRAVDVFRSEVDSIPKGYSAAVVLEGDGAEFLREMIESRPNPCPWHIELASGPRDQLVDALRSEAS